jgi:hypothetical protein
MRSGVDELGLEHLWVVYPGKENYPMLENISVLPLGEVETLKEEMENTP